MVFVIVTNASGVVGKEVYSGDDVESMSIINKKQISNPDMTYSVVDEPTYNQSVLVTPQTKQNIDWQSAKKQGPDAAIAFIATTLGLQ